jgi:polysaccharide biosynthesis/export protein
VSHLFRLCVFAVVVALAGCAQSPQSTSMVGAVSLTDSAFDKSTTQATAALPTAKGSRPKIDLTNPSATNVDDADYHIAALDMLEVSVFQAPELSKTVRVAADGRISLPLIGEVMASGKSAHQLETEVASKLGAKYLQSPEVSVFVKDAVSQRVTVEGAVAKPGIYPLTGETTLMQVIVLSGGLNEIADNKAIVVFRNTGGKRQAAVFDYKAIRKGTIDDPVMQGGDIVAVDQSGAKAAMRSLRETIGVLNLFTPLAPLI